MGDSGDTFTVPSGATIDNLGTATGVWYDDNQVQSNIAVLGFKVAVNGSLVKYDLRWIKLLMNTRMRVEWMHQLQRMKTRDASGKYYSGAGAGTDSDRSGQFGYKRFRMIQHWYVLLLQVLLQVTDGGTGDILVDA